MQINIPKLKPFENIDFDIIRYSILAHIIAKYIRHKGLTESLPLTVLGGTNIFDSIEHYDNIREIKYKIQSIVDKILITGLYNDFIENALSIYYSSIHEVPYIERQFVSFDYSWTQNIIDAVKLKTDIELDISERCHKCSINNFIFLDHLPNKRSFHKIINTLKKQKDSKFKLEIPFELNFFSNVIEMKEISCIELISWRIEIKDFIKYHSILINQIQNSAIIFYNKFNIKGLTDKATIIYLLNTIQGTLDWAFYDSLMENIKHQAKIVNSIE